MSGRALVAVHTENSIQRFSALNDIVTFRLPGECALGFIFLNIADFKGIRAGMQFGEGQALPARDEQLLCGAQAAMLVFVVSPRRALTHAFAPLVGDPSVKGGS
jgi:hypothetical protein